MEIQITRTAPETAGDCPHLVESSEPNGVCPPLFGGFRTGSSHSISRRRALSIGGAGLLGVNMPRLIQAAETSGARPARAKSVIFLYQFGGPSHLDTFDPKPDAPAGVRSQFNVIDTAAPGIRICDRLPQMAKVMNEVTLVRTVFHTMK